MDQKELDKINEMFALPIGMKKVMTLNGEELYTSQVLKDKLKVALSKTDHTRAVSSSINKMIDKEKLIPVFYNKRIFNLIIFKVFAPNGMSNSTLGFYSQTHDKIILILDNNTSFGFASNQWMGALTIHELMHRGATKLKSTFFNIFKEELSKYYLKTYSVLLEISEINKDMKDKVENHIDYLTKIEMSPKNISLKEFLKTNEKFLYSIEKYSSLHEDDAKNRINNYLDAIYTYFTNPDNYLTGFRSEFYPTAKALFKGYEALFDERPATLVIQEAIYPSEVIAIFSENTDASKTHAVVKSLANK
jgi:hypothetical protein